MSIPRSRPARRNELLRRDPPAAGDSHSPEIRRRRRQSRASAGDFALQWVSGGLMSGLSRRCWRSHVTRTSARHSSAAASIFASFLYPVSVMQWSIVEIVGAAHFPNCLHDQHLLSGAPLSWNEGEDGAFAEVGQYWTPIGPQDGSLLHAGSHMIAWNFSAIMVSSA